MGDGIDHYTVNLPLRGAQTVTQDLARHKSDPAHGILLSPGQQLQVDIDRDYRSIFVTIKRQIMELALSRLIGRQAKRRWSSRSACRWRRRRPHPGGARPSIT